MSFRKHAGSVSYYNIATIFTVAVPGKRYWNKCCKNHSKHPYLRGDSLLVICDTEVVFHLENLPKTAF